MISSVEPIVKRLPHINQRLVSLEGGPVNVCLVPSGAAMGAWVNEGLPEIRTNIRRNDGYIR